MVKLIKAGKMKPVDFLIGQVMRKTGGKADPKKVRELLLQKNNCGYGIGNEADK